MKKQKDDNASVKERQYKLKKWKEKTNLDSHGIPSKENNFCLKFQKERRRNLYTVYL